MKPISNLELWSLLTTYRTRVLPHTTTSEVVYKLFEEPITGPLKSKMRRSAILKIVIT